ncbi:MAG TPA: metal ABC transporter ATP-binding protein [Steroidobacteraceae bacterium]|nr:metal ABC transporter ATP-binding protein [Steroidobacteraceae bacterium]
MLVLHDLTLSYDGRAVVEQLAGRFEAGSLTAIVGPNGAGKSTLLNAIMGLVKPVSGRIERAWPGGRVAYLPQRADLDRAVPVSVFEFVALGAWRRVGAFGKVAGAVSGEAASALEQVGLGAFGDRMLSSLSVGQLQRALFARVLLMDAPVVLLDEPFNAIDARTTLDLLHIIQRWHAERRTVVAVLHDLAQVRECFPQTLLLARERIAWGPTREILTSKNLSRAQERAWHWEDTAAEPARGAAA